MSALPNERRHRPGGTKRPPTVMVGRVPAIATGAGEITVMVRHVAISTKDAGEPIVMVGLDPTIAKDAGRRVWL